MSNFQTRGDNACGFCENIAVDPEYFTSLTMYRNPYWGNQGFLEAGQRSVSYQEATVRVPRCKSCAARHGKLHTSGGWGVVAGFALSIFLYLVLPIKDFVEGPSGLGLILIVPIVGLMGWLGYRIGSKVGNRRYGPANQGDGQSHPIVLKLRAQGWTFDAPNVVQGDRRTTLGLK